ncbi:hypothetical protein TNIN_87451 [Trichonephila inaurata madagascariensis]|uniref:Uncharacterized protein n=1 Tax=Trichonephila inaurata madagascariensis TaxID=2747483 RepID=A0A8X6YJG8_9ARAC|nr:hypothetical protein TNIN_87451 [Trichonephila inaurata madagascariensis]
MRPIDQPAQPGAANRKIKNDPHVNRLEKKPLSLLPCEKRNRSPVGSCFSVELQGMADRRAIPTACPSLGEQLTQFRYALC